MLLFFICGGVWGVELRRRFTALSDILVGSSRACDNVGKSVVEDMLVED